MVAAAAMVAAAMIGCALPTGGDGPVANLAGAWDYLGTQEAPALTLEGTLTLTQNRANVNGALSWSERDAFGNVELRGGQVIGVVLGLHDVDFDVTQAGDDRRHVARVDTDTIEGVWASLNSSASGVFRAVRRAP